MASRTVLKKVDMQDFVPISDLDRAFNKSGLCAFCEAKYSCSLSQESGLVFDCDDYRATSELAPVISFSTLGEIHDTDEEDEFHGLCAECQRRDICPLKYIRGGVWHCEEFL